MKNNSSVCDACQHINNQAWDYPCPTCNNGSNYKAIPTKCDGVATSRPEKANLKRSLAVWVLATLAAILFITAKVAVMTAIMYVSDILYFHNFKSIEDIVAVSALLALLIEQLDVEYVSIKPKIQSLFKK